MFLFPKLPSDL